MDWICHYLINKILDEVVFMLKKKGYINSREAMILCPTAAWYPDDNINGKQHQYHHYFFGYRYITF